MSRCWSFTCSPAASRSLGGIGGLPTAGADNATFSVKRLVNNKLNPLKGTQLLLLLCYETCRLLPLLLLACCLPLASTLIANINESYVVFCDV